MGSKLIRKVIVKSPPPVIVAKQRFAKKGELTCNAARKSFDVFVYPSLKDIKWMLAQKKGKTDISSVRFSKDRRLYESAVKMQSFYVKVGFVKVKTTEKKKKTVSKCSAEWTKHGMGIRVTSKKDASHPIQLRIPVDKPNGIYVIFFITKTHAQIIERITKKGVHLVIIGQPTPVK